MALPSLGEQKITLVQHDGRRELLTSPTALMGGFSQRLFLVSPRGRFLAVSTSVPAGGNALTIFEGAETIVVDDVFGRDARFSSDERYLATLRQSPGEPGWDVVLVDLESEQQRVLGSIADPRWLEWVAGGVVVLGQRLPEASELGHRGPRERELTYFPLDGEAIELASWTPESFADPARFTAARDGTRVMFFRDGRIYTVETSGGKPVHRGELPGHLEDNVEMAPDGSEAALVVSGGVHRWTEADGLVTLDERHGVHSIWYSPDGSKLAYASAEVAIVRAGDRVHRLPADGEAITALRFRQDARGGLLVSMGRRAVWWQPQQGTTATLARSARRRTLLGADLYRGGTVLWTQGQAGRAPIRNPWTRKKAARR